MEPVFLGGRPSGATVNRVGLDQGVSEEEWNVCQGDEEGLAEIMANAESGSLGISFVPVISGGKASVVPRE